jgi:hypothetical protein
MPVTYKKIASVSLTGGAAASMEFTSIPGTYTDLVILMSARSVSGDSFGAIEFNGSTAGYTSIRLSGDGSSAGSASRTDSLAMIQTNSARTASTFGNTTIYIANYAGATNKSVSVDFVEENNATTALGALTAFLWSNTAAITSVKLTDGSDYAQYSTATLYGISKS